MSDILTVNGVTRTAGSSLLVRKTIKIPKAAATCLADHVTLECQVGDSAVQNDKPRASNKPPSPYAAKEKQHEMEDR